LQPECATGAISSEHLQHFSELHQKCDLEYLLKNIPTAIDHSLEGVNRVAKIVKGFKEFSHPGSEEKRGINLNQTIETTISVSKHEWKYCAHMVTVLDPDLPLVPCLVGEFNQVILNLIVNSAHAISGVLEKNGNEKNSDQKNSDEKNGSGKGTITITTSKEGEWARIAVADTGGGIPAEIHSRIFEPFFTTKEVGKGTGQGLALAHAAIVNRHQGQLWFESQVGKGTTFFIRLPLEAGIPAS
ncbi:MAG: HAMP domain-containing sensor histidine kinase, partial [Terriglobales bacterium]